MKPTVLILLALLAGCCKPPPPPPACPEVPDFGEIAPRAPAPAPAPNQTSTEPKATAKVANDYQDKAQQAVAAVVSPDATPSYVREVHEADRRARRAIVALEKEGKRPNPKTLERARVAVQHLANVLANSPGESD
jgi:hypothetical protein